MSSGRDQDYVLDVSRLTFYKHYFGKVLIALVVSVIVIGILVTAMIVIKNQKVEREYFAVDPQTGRMTPIVPISEPYVSESALLNWFVDCATSNYTYDFVNYQKQFQQHSECFTPRAWEQHMADIQKAGTLDRVKAQRLVSSAVAAGAPVITMEGLRAGSYSWQIELPLTVTLQGSSAQGRTQGTQKLLVTAIVSRVPTTQNRNGVGIDSYVEEEK